jgi:methyl-accepting chemotaxis protein
MTSVFFKRRHLIVDRFQYRLVAISVVHFGLVLLIFLVAMLLPLMLQLDDPSATYLEKQQVADVLLFFNEQLWLPLAAVFLLLTVHSLFVSHRIAGPLYRFRMVFKAMAGGDLAIRANIRKHDYLHPHARALNEMIEALETRIRGLDDQTLHLKEGAAQLKEAVSSGAKVEAQRALERVESQLEVLKGQLAHFAKKS